VVHSEATGQDRLLQVAKRFADHLVARFGREPGQIRGYCGHPEIELALLRLYQLSGEKRYLDLCRYFINERGQSPNFFEQEAVARLDMRPFRPNHPGSPYSYMQAHEPLRAQTKVVGHAVRAMYLFTAAAGLALEDGDAELLATCERLWQDVIKTKLYITGGIGSASENEGFTRDYDFPMRRPMPRPAPPSAFSSSPTGYSRRDLTANTETLWSWRSTITSFLASAWRVEASSTTIPWPVVGRTTGFVGRGGAPVVRQTWPG